MSKIYGFHSVISFLTYKPENIIKIFLSNKRNDDRINRIISLANKLRIEIEFKDINFLNSLSKNEKNQGIIASVELPKSLDEKDLKLFIDAIDNHSRILVLDSIQDPRNLGACLRSALAFEFDAVIINKDGSSPINEYVLKTSVGAILNLNIFYVTNLSRSLNILKKFDYWVLGLDGHGEGSIFSEKFSLKTAVVLGSEGSGIRKLVKENCDHLIKIPISDKVESLNISVAAGIIMYELKKQHTN